MNKEKREKKENYKESRREEKREETRRKSFKHCKWFRVMDFNCVSVKAKWSTPVTFFRISPPLPLVLVIKLSNQFHFYFSLLQFVMTLRQQKMRIKLVELKVF